MKRRAAIQNILIAAAGTLLLPGCSETNVIDFLSNDRLLLDQKHKDYLSRISESFLPINGVSDKIGPAVDFILSMLNDCHTPEAISSFATGFEQYKELMKKSQLKMQSADLSKALPIVENLLKEEAEKEESTQENLITFINTARNLSIQHVVSSEYYMTEYLNYQLVPGRFDGCLDV